jgi:hypothetical protein
VRVRAGLGRGEYHISHEWVQCGGLK